MVGDETSGDLPGLRARADRASVRAAGLAEQLRSRSAAPGEVAETVAELSALRTLLDGDRALLGLVTVRLGALLALRYATGQGTQEDRERAQLLLREVRDPSTPAGQGLPATERRWAALFLLMTSDYASPGGRPGTPPSIWPVFDQIRLAEPAGIIAGAEEFTELADEAAELPLPPAVLAQLRQTRDITAYLQRGGLSDPQGLLKMLPANFPFKEELRAMLAVVGDVPTPEPDAGTESKAGPLDPLTSSWLSSLLGIVETLRTGRPESFNLVLDRLSTELDQPADHGDQVEIQNLIRLVLQMGQLFSGSHQDGAVAGDQLQAMVDHFERGTAFDPGSVLGVGVRALALFTEVRNAEQAESVAELARLVGELESMERSTPADHAFRWLVLLALGSASSALGMRTDDGEQLRRGISQQEESLSRIGYVGLPDELTAQMKEGLRTARAWLGQDPGLLPELAPVPPEASAETHHGFALTAGLRYSLTRDPADLDAAIGALERVRAHVRQGRSPHLAAQALRELAENYRTRLSHTHDPADREAAAEAAMESLQALAGDVVLQTGPEHGLLTARQGADFGVRAAIWAASQGNVEDAVAALELGRALVLQAASTSRAVPELLADRGHPELARAWRSADTGPGASTGASADGDRDPRALPRELPSSLRRRALEALGHRDPGGALFRTPTVAELTSAVGQGEADALVYLLAGPGEQPGMAVVVGPDVGTGVRALPLLSGAASGPLESYLDAAAARQRTGSASAVQAWEDALVELCDWATGAAVVPVLTGIAERLAGNANRRRDRPGPPRIVLVPCGRLGIVPWHAARLPAGSPHRYACEAMVISYAASGRQFADSVRRARRTPAADAVLVADPSLTLPHVELEVTALHEACYPQARLFGDLYEPPVEPEATGTPDDLLDALDGTPSLLHVACHGSAGTSPTASALQLASPDPDSAPGPGAPPTPDRLTVARLLEHQGRAESTADGPLIVLSACETDLSNRDHDEALTLTTAFLSRGARDVVGSRWATRDSAAALMMAVFHHYLRIEGHSPVDALRAAQRWMLDPDRRTPASLGGRLRHELGKGPALDHPAAWAAFTHQGHPGPSAT
jgi:hypothetical protein